MGHMYSRFDVMIVTNAAQCYIGYSTSVSIIWALRKIFKLFTVAWLKEHSKQTQ